jgi:hypothetical protein
MKHDRAKILAHLTAILAQLEREHSLAEQNAAAVALGRPDLVRSGQVDMFGQNSA